jgi:hypothetical protein
MNHWTNWLLLAVAVLVGGWLLFDGMRAFIVGDYVTPKSGDYAGKLGPWANLLQRIGIRPRSALAKALHVLAGAAWLLSAAGLWMQAGWWRMGMAAAAVLSLWYLPFGMLGAIIVLAILILR